MKAIYTNKATKESYTLAGVESIQKAYDMYKFACSRNGWNPAAFTKDVNVKVV